MERESDVSIQPQLGTLHEEVLKPAGPKINARNGHPRS